MFLSSNLNFEQDKSTTDMILILIESDSHIQVIQRKREEYAGYLTQYFHNKEDIHKDTFR